MYDKISIWMDRVIVGDSFPAITDYLDNAKQETDLITNEVRTYGSVEGLKVSLYSGGLYIVGSLAKYFNGGSNVYPLDRHTTATAIEKLSDALHIDIGGGKVTSIEFGTNFLMLHPVSEYVERLGEMPRLLRVAVTPNSIRYEGTGKKKPRRFAIYDKIADAKIKGMEYPVTMENANLLRYEMRLQGRLPYQLGWPEVNASTLYDTTFYRMMVKRYQDNYFSITKQNKVKTDAMAEIKTVSDAFNVFVARLITQNGQTQIAGFLDELKEAGVFTDRKNYSRLKKKILEVATKANFSVSDELIKELDREIQNCGAYV